MAPTTNPAAAPAEPQMVDSPATKVAADPTGQRPSGSASAGRGS